MSESAEDDAHEELGEFREFPYRAVPAERLRLGDHACMTFDDREAQWQVLTAYTRTSLAQGEKVLIVLDPDDLGDDEVVAHLDRGSGHVAAARDGGQLELRRNTDVYLPDGRFSKERQLATYADEVDRAYDEGWSGLRLAADMTWALRPGVDSEKVVDYEAALEPLFADPRFTAICWYDRKRFSEELVASMRRVHPLQCMERMDALDVDRTEAGTRIAGSAEPGTRTDFMAALRTALESQTVRGPFHFELDLTDLCFMEAHCAWQLVGFAKSLPGGSRVTVRCGQLLELVLRQLGADGVPQLVISVEEEE
ncbi:MEDS domain-containing protein [Streptomyces fulvoviolaceus]|uniref:MEDS domain-containing protein n=1 Tax=Streptomyces fulvoviolaceus TaxID=285535 RepID=UPI0021C15DAA|nr:MEDS domain-containing protein [Streptomyces fulvoviolaceus]MCT9081327.1 MEDS domain-containing protein [Streptomyces fulvoviolaceus]